MTRCLLVLVAVASLGMFGSGGWVDAADLIRIGILGIDN